MKDAKTKPSKIVDRNAHWIEWVTGGVCTLVVLAMIGWIGYEAATGSEGKAELSTRVVHSEHLAGGYSVTFIIENTGKRTASAVVAQGEIKDGDRVVETSEITFDYVPAHSSASGALLFRNDPAAGRFTIRPAGYTDP